MLNDNIRRNLRKVLEQKLEELLLKRDHLEKLRSQITEIEEQIYSMKILLGDGDAYEFDNRSSINSPVKPREPRKGSVTDTIRSILEQYPEIKPEEGIRLVKEKHSGSNIDKNSWSQWNTYYRTGRYRMDANAYRRRYKQEPPY